MQAHLQPPFPSLIKIPVCLLRRLVCIMIPQVVFILKQVLRCFLSWAAFGFPRFTNNFSFYLLSFLCSYLVFSLNVPSQISSRHLFPHNSNVLHNFSVNFFFWPLPPILICSDCSSRDFNLLLSLSWLSSLPLSNFTPSFCWSTSCSSFLVPRKAESFWGSVMVHQFLSLGSHCRLCSQWC